MFFSIIIPTYNRSKFLQQTLKSLLAQTYNNFEIIVVDDGGCDDSKQVVESFNDSRLMYYWKINAERGAARNFGAGKAKGIFINFFDSDDIAYENHLQTAFEYLQKNEDSIVFHTSYEWRDANSMTVKKQSVCSGALNKVLIRGNILSCNNVFIRREEFSQLKFSESRILSGTEDWLLWLRLASRYEITGVSEITSAIIDHSARSMATATGKEMLLRAEILQSEIAKDEKVMLAFPSAHKIIYAEMLSLTSLYFAIEGRKNSALYYFFKAIKMYFPIIKTRRTPAIFKYIIIGR